MESIFALENIYLNNMKNNNKFRRNLLQNCKESIVECLKRMENYYCKEIIEILNMIMVQKRSVQEIKNFVEKHLKPLGNPFIRDVC
jgi:hypothetical protein